MVTKQKVPQSPISFSMHPHIFGKHAMKSEPLGMNSTYFFSVYNTLPQCKIGQDKLGMGHFLTLTNSHCMDSSSEHFKSGCQFSLTTMENKTIARTFSTITCAPLWTYLVFHVLRINFRENGPPMPSSEAFGLANRPRYHCFLRSLVDTSVHILSCSQLINVSSNPAMV